MVAIIDYGMGNVRSLRNALAYIDAPSLVTADPDEILNASRLILPGVGAFGDAMANIHKRGLSGPLCRAVFEHHKPFLGICLGMQLLAKSSTEHGVHEGLGWLNADVRRFEFECNTFKTPHVGWNTIQPQIHPLFKHLEKADLDFYFVHSFHINCDHPDNIAATCDYGYRFTAAVCKGNIFGTQFHPEKSQDNGLQVLTNFINWQPAPDG